jgi:hypothetical protein
MFNINRNLCFTPFVIFNTSNCYLKNVLNYHEFKNEDGFVSAMLLGFLLQKIVYQNH